ncbi:hypothetical protein LTR85_011662 [Meristemomyces frigidus]|nr:hypothetical protein LTR85_011662 [Meristemomyces frigidus]
MATSPQALDVLTLTATAAQELLQDGKVNSVQLVEAYLAQIQAHNHTGLYLNALISITPKETLVATAHRLDEERTSGRTRSPLHGIPFVVKDVFTTHPSLGLPTTAGSPCFAAAEAKRTAPLIEHLLDMGMILLGKANLTEFCGLKMKGLTPGWSPMGGQTQSPYIFGGLEPDEKLIGHSSIGGSSSGSASAVAAGFAPLSIGTECCGSLITPANRAGLYALKCGLGEVNAAGSFGYTDCLDCIGGMAKSAADLAVFTAALMQRTEPFDSSGGFTGLSVAFTSVKEWRLPDEICAWPRDTREQMETGYASAITRMKELGAKVTENANISIAWDIFKTEDGKSHFYEIAFYQLYNKYLPAFLDEFSSSEVRSLEDIIAYNEQHSDVCMPPDHPEQGELHDLLANTRKREDIDAMIPEMQRRGKSALDKLLEAHDVVVALADSPLVMYSAAAGCPIACLSLGTVKYSELNERPYGLCVTAPKGREDLLLRFLAACEAAFAPRPLPRPLLQST